MMAETLRKHVAIIHAYSQMSALQRKIINVLLYNAVNSDQALAHQNSVAVECQTSYANLCKKIGFNSKNTKYIKEAIDDLASIKIEWNLLRDKVPTNVSFLNLRILHGPPTFYKDGTFNYSFHKLMIDLAKNPDIYGVIDLNIQAQFDSKYGHSMYENCTRFVHLQKNKIIQLATFRKLLGVNENIYPSMRELKRNVIRPAVEESNDRSGFVINLSDVKLGKKTTGFELSVQTKKKIPQIKEENSFTEHEKTYNEIAKTFGKISDYVLHNIFKNYSEKYISEKIVYTKRYAKKSSSGKFPIPYFISALRDDYRSNQDHMLIEKPLSINLCLFLR